jgi:glycosyltransferase involved in cell wall biosynthesis
LDLADVIFVLSSHHRQTFEQSGVDPSKLVIAPPGIDVNLFHPLPRLRHDRFTVGFVGQIGQRKGLSYLIDAVSRSGVPDADLVLVGPVIGTFAPWATAPGVHHLPSQGRLALPAIYATFDVFALPSLVEGFGLTALEAMACGVPTIVSEHTFASDVITDGVDGYIVPIRNPEAIAERIRYLHDNPAERQRMGEAARQRALGFSLAVSGDRVAQMIGQKLAT